MIQICNECIMKSDDGLSEERANRIADAVEDVEKNVARLRELQAASRSEYVNYLAVNGGACRWISGLTDAYAVASVGEYSLLPINVPDFRAS